MPWLLAAKAWIFWPGKPSSGYPMQPCLPLAQKSAIAFRWNVIYKLPRASCTTNYNFQVFNQEVPYEEVALRC